MEAARPLPILDAARVVMLAGLMPLLASHGAAESHLVYRCGVFFAFAAYGASTLYAFARGDHPLLLTFDLATMGIAAWSMMVSAGRVASW